MSLHVYGHGNTEYALEIRAKYNLCLVLGKYFREIIHAKNKSYESRSIFHGSAAFSRNVANGRGTVQRRLHRHLGVHGLCRRHLQGHDRERRVQRLRTRQILVGSGHELH